MWIFKRSLSKTTNKAPHGKARKQPTPVKEEEIRELADKLWKAGGCLKGVQDYYREQAEKELESYYLKKAETKFKKFNSGNLTKNFIGFFVLDFLPIRIIWERICPPTNVIKNSENRREPSTFTLWILGIHFAAFTLASGRYENRKDALETRLTFISRHLTFSLLWVLF